MVTYRTKGGHCCFDYVLPNASTFISHRKCFRLASQVLSSANEAYCVFVAYVFVQSYHNLLMVIFRLFLSKRNDYWCFLLIFVPINH